MSHVRPRPVDVIGAAIAFARYASV